MGILNSLAAQLGQFLATYGLLAIFVVMLLKEIGVPVPVPSDLIMITAGVQAATGSYSVFELLLAIEFAVLLGGTAQFLIVRSAGRRFIYSVGRFVGLTAERLDRAGAMLQRRGPIAVFLGLNLPGARAGIIPAAGLAGLGYSAFAVAMLGGSGVFYGWHVALGYLVGPSATDLLGKLNLPLLPLMAVLAVLGLLVWLLLRMRARRRAANATSAVDPLNSWTDAACPVCLALAAAQQARSRPAAQTEQPQGQEI
jgi:membrane protein DedA with SNARE-associated domain